MKKLLFAFAAILLIFSCHQKEPQIEDSINTDTPVSLHPDNPHYFQYHGKTLALITSAEHYGALINLDFDYKKYLQKMP